MRLRITLSGTNGTKPSVKSVRSLIYRTLSLADGNYAKWLHDYGYEYRTVRREETVRQDQAQGLQSPEYFSDRYKAAKPFVFSHPYVVKDVTGEVIMFKLASPDSEFASIFALGAAKMMAIPIPPEHGVLGIARISMAPDPEIYSSRETTKHYFCLSPIIAQGKRDGKTHYYMDANDPEVAALLFRNITSKWLSVTGQNIGQRFVRDIVGGRMETEPFAIRFDRPQAVMNHMGHKEFPAFMTSFTVKTTGNIHRAILELGLGQKNAMGFGMVEEAGNARFRQGLGRLLRHEGDTEEKQRH